MAFTDIEMAILSQSAYCKYPDSSANQSLYKFLTDNEDYLTQKLGAGYTKALEALINKVKDKPYTIVLTCDDMDGTGFAAFAVADPNNEVTVACRGTEGFSMDYDSRKDVWADVQLAGSLQTNQQAKMQEFVRLLEKKNYSGYSFAGHSLGGNLAMYGAIAMNDPIKLKRVVTFNAPGFNAAFWEQNRERINLVSGRITAYQNEMDAVSDCFVSPGRINILENDGFDVNYDGVTGHSLSALQVSNDGATFAPNASGMKHPTAVGILAFGVTTITDAGLLLLSPTINSVSYVARGVASTFGTAIKVPVSDLQEYARKMQEYADSSADIFDRISNSLTCLKDNGQWQGLSMEAAVVATQSNQKKFQEALDELQALAVFMKNFANEMEAQDEAIKKRILAV